MAIDLERDTRAWIASNIRRTEALLRAEADVAVVDMVQRASTWMTPGRVARSRPRVDVRNLGSAFVITLSHLPFFGTKLTDRSLVNAQWAVLLPAAEALQQRVLAHLANVWR